MAGQKRKILSLLILVAIIWAGLFFALQVLAQTDPGAGYITTEEMRMGEIGETIGLPTTDIRLVVARIIRVALGFLGIVALVLILYGGFVWMTAGGNEENIQKAKKILVNAAIGLAIILSAYAIASFVINALVSATTGGEGVPGGPGGPPGSFTNVLYITSMPGDDLGCGIRNVHPIITFNKAIDITTVPDNLVIRNKQTGAPADGVWRLFAVDKQNTIVFDPIGDCGVEPPQNDCLDASTTYQIFFVNASNIKSQDGLNLNCNVGNYKLQCKNLPAVEFITGDEVDVSPPTIAIVNPFNNQTFPQGAVVPVEINYTDNFGVQNVSLYVNGTPIDSQSIGGCQKSGTIILNWPSGSSPTGTYSLESIAYDHASLSASTSRNILLLPGHCFNDQLDSELGEIIAGPPACGGACGACAGSPCTENSDCASGWCEDGFCVDRMKINGFSPTAGAVSTTYVSIWGQYFGDDGGHVFFRKSGGDGWSEAFVANCGAGIDNWNKSQIIVKVPSDAITGPIKVETAGTEETKFIDITDNDGWGYQGNFTVNNELLPGLCAVVPNYGAPYTNVILIGENFGSSQTQGQDNVFFSSSTPIIYSWSSNSVTARVPALGTGAVPVKLMNNNKESNSVQFNVREVLDSGAPMIESIYPESGARGEYITIIGKNFGSYTGKVLFKLGEADAIYGTFDFPEECEGATWSDKQVVVKFPTSSVQEGQKYKVQIQRSSDSAISPIGATFDLKTGDPAPGICKISPDTGPIPFAQTATMKIFGEYYTRGNTTAVPFFWLSAASPTTTAGRTTTGTISVSNTQAELRPPLDAETGPVVMYRSTDQKMGNSMPFTVYNCLENNNTCADPAYQCCTAGNDAGICRKNDELCDGQTRSTGYMWRFNTGPFPPTARVVERCDSDTDLGKNLPSPSPNIRWSLFDNNDHFNVCRTAEITIEFSMKMLQNTINSSSIQVYKCSTSSLAGVFIPSVNSCEHIGGSIQMKNDSYVLYSASAEENTDHDYIQMFPQSGKWEDDSFFHVVLNQDIMSTPTSYMYGDEARALGAQNLKPQRPCGPGSAYCFIFKTNARDCKLAKVVVTPYTYWTAVLEKPIMRRGIKDDSNDPGTDLFYRGTGLSDQKCIMMNMDAYSWDWSIQPGRTEYTDLYGLATGTNGNMQRVSALGNTVGIGLTGPNDAANIEATATKGGAGSVAPGLVGWWTLDGDLLDKTENANNGSFQGEFNYVDGQIGRAIQLFGNSAVALSKPFILPDAKNPRTMCAWGKPSNVNDGWRWLVAYGTAQNGKAMFVGMQGQSLIGGGYDDDISYNNFWQTNVWRHVCLTFNGTLAILYADGEEVTRASKNWNLEKQYAYIGAQVHSPPNEFWQGDIDDVRIYNKVLSPEEVLALYQGQNLSDFDQKTGVSPLTIDLSKPRVVEYWPNCLEACPNAEIGARFNIRMSDYNLNNGVKVYKCHDENCFSTTPVQNVDIRLADDSRFLSIVPSGSNETAVVEWEKNTIYLVVLSSAEESGQLWSQAKLDDSHSKGKPMREAFSWRFRTKSETCTVDKVTVTPVLFRARTVDARKVYSAQARSAPDECSAKGQLLNAWSLNWDWTSSDPKVAYIQKFQTKGKSQFCTANCVKKGSSIPYGEIIEPLCGNYIVEAGEDCDPPLKIGDSVACALNCLRPGNNNATTTIPFGSTVDLGLCGDGVVSSTKGEKCDPRNSATSAGCTANCLFAGSSPQTGSEEVGASICGNGMIGAGEDCDIGTLPDYWRPTSSLYCSKNCLHLGTPLNAYWCAVNTSTFSGFSMSEYKTACATAKSICGDEIKSPDEDEACESTSTPMSICTDRCLINVYSDVLKKCVPTTTAIVFFEGSEFIQVVKTEGCNSIGQYEGSSLMYSTPSLCGDGIVGIGEHEDCETNFVFVRTFIDPWALAIGVGEGTTTPNWTQITDITGTGTQTTVENKVYVKSGTGQFEILCGYFSDSECQAQTGNPYMGVADNSCCYERARMIDTYPVRSPNNSQFATAYDVCPNTYIEATFDKVIDVKTLPGSVYIARGYYIDDINPQCPEDQVDVTPLIKGYIPVYADASGQIQPWYQRVWAGIKDWFKNLFGMSASAEPRNKFVSNIYCVGDEAGVPEVVVPDPKGVNSTSSVLIKLKKPLAFNSDYAILFRPGVKDVRGVSVGTAAQWQFITGEEICALDKAEIEPPEYMFKKSGVTQDFLVKSFSQNNQLIQPVVGYAWEYNWGPEKNEFISIANATGTTNVITSKNRNGEVDLTATSFFTENIFPINSPTVTGKSRVIVFLCENPWPSGSLDNFPFIDEAHDFLTYYCMDYGMVGVADDLPHVTSSKIWTTTQSNGPSLPYVKRYIFINTDNKDAIGIQVFYNNNHLSVSDWYRAQGFSGQMNFVKIDGFDAITDGNNYYIDALVQPPPISEACYPFCIYSNIYQFSINSDATAKTREVFNQIIKNLKFNLRLKNEPYCAVDYSGAGIDYNMPCSNDMDCLAQMEKIKKDTPTTTKANYFCHNQKDKLQRNYARLSDLRGMIKTIDWGRGAVAIWPMNFVTYDKFPDSTGRGFEALIKEQTGKVSVVAGRTGQSVRIEQPAYLEVMKPTDIGNRSFTIAHWIKTTSSQYQAYTVSNCLMGDGYRFGISEGKLTVLIGNSNSNYKWSNACTTDTVNDGMWHHVAAVFDRENKKIDCYIDGLKNGTVALASSYYGMKEDSTHLTRIGTPACVTDKCMKCTTNGLSSGPKIPGCDPVFRADIDDVRIYARALNPDEMRDLFYDNLPYDGGYPNLADNTYLPGQALSVWTIPWNDLGAKLKTSLPIDPINKLAQSGTCFLPVSNNQYTACFRDTDCAPVPTNGRVSYWTADEGGKDEGTLKNNAVFEGTVGTVAGKGHGKAFEFAGDTTAKVVAGNFDEYNGDSFTISAWIYPTRKNTATIIKKGGSDGDGNSLGGFILEYSGLQFTGTQVRFNNGTVRFAFFPNANDPNKYYAIDSTEPLALNQWHQITVTFNNNAKRASLFINGQAVSKTLRVPPTGAEANINTPFLPYATNTLPIEIGQNFNGKIDNVAFYSRELEYTVNNNEIYNLYAGLCVLHDPITGWSAEDRRFSFACNTSSFAYRYNFVSSTKSYLLRANLETLQQPGPANYNVFIKDFTSNKVDFNYGICASASEISSPYNVYCGDSILGGDEQCDPPGSASYNTSNCPVSATKKTCSSQCVWGAETTATCRDAIGGRCGDGKVQYLAGELCDDGPLNGQLGKCNEDCNGIVNTCGNNELDEGEFCDTVVESTLEICKFRSGVNVEFAFFPKIANLPAKKIEFPCSQYSLYSGYSCNWNCTNFGGYCGDGILQTEHGETCEGDEVPCLTADNVGGKAKCTLCHQQQCVPISVSPPAGVCGNGIVEEFEACDRGAQNGIACTPVYPQQSCTYCSADCKNVITKDIICGNGILDAGEVCDPGGANRGYARMYFGYPPNPAQDYCLPCKSDCSGWNVSAGSPVLNSMSSDCAIYGSASNVFGRGYCGDGVRQFTLIINPWTGLLESPFFNQLYEQCDGNGSTCTNTCPEGQVQICFSNCLCGCSFIISSPGDDCGEGGCIE